MSYAFPTTQVNTTNLDAGTDSPATARTDLLSAVQTLNTILQGLGVAGGFPAIDANGQVVLGAGMTFGINPTSGFPRLVLSATAYIEWNTTANTMNYYLSGVLKGSMPMATPATNNYNDLLNKPSVGPLANLNAGLGLLSDSTNLNVDSTFLSGLLAMPLCGCAAAGTQGQGVNNGNQTANYLYTKILDTHNANPNGNQFTCPAGQAGTYYFKFITAFSQGVALKKNGTIFATGTTTVSGTVTLAVGDYVNPYYNGNTNSGENGTSSKGFGGYRVS